METIFSLITSTLIFITGLLPMQGIVGVQNQSMPDSVEIGLSETSPAGPQGGFAVPASGCTDLSHGPIHQCNKLPEISSNPYVIRMGESATVTWKTNGIAGCELIGDLAAAGSLSTNAQGSEVVQPSSDAVYTIRCTSDTYMDIVTVRVLPRIQET